ncbi:cytochrome P450 CYP72A219-like [Tripterygium wilfordii]|uniref:cytochrome P450 CYP72A219-like n=1 Tax=Tripterygium wilfordii TaxID=458696 RepID=UPI0018F800E7|nr:cytochrome P450 CYP72A219-like [Tripterygium wilfordii]
MEGLIVQTMLYSFVLLVIHSLIRFTLKFWWRPKSLEKHLRRQGIRGSSYNPFHDDMKESVKSCKEAWSKPMSLNHQIAPYVSPFYHQMIQNYGKVCLSWVRTTPRLIVADPGLMRLILTDKQGHIVIPPQNPLVDLLTLGVSTLEGEKWAKRRRLITPAFHFDKLKGMVPEFSASCWDLINRWNDRVSDKGSIELDVAPEFQILAADVISRTAFGSSYEEGKEIFELQEEQVRLVLEAHLGTYFPGFRFLPTKKNNRRYKIDRVVKATLRNMIYKKEHAMQNGDTSCDLLGLLLQYKEQSDGGMTIEDVIEECKLFYFAGQETTANLLTWTMILLSMNRNWQEKAREEVLKICGKKTPGIEDLHHLKIVSMILHEVLRLYPPVTTLLRYTHQETNIGGMSIPAGVEVLLPTLFIHHDHEYWGEDAEQFRPERFNEGVSKASKDNAFYPFGWGHRICLGQNFAMIEAKMALAMILQNFWFELSPLYAHAPGTVILLQPQHGAPIILHPL